MRLTVKELRKMEDITLEEFNQGKFTFQDDDKVIIERKGQYIVLIDDDGFKFDEVHADDYDNQEVKAMLQKKYYINSIEYKNGKYDITQDYELFESDDLDEVIAHAKDEFDTLCKADKKHVGYEVLERTDDDNDDIIKVISLYE